MVGAEDDAVGAGETEMVAGVAGRMQAGHAGNHAAVLKRHVRLEGRIGTAVEGEGPGPVPAFSAASAPR